MGATRASRHAGSHEAASATALRTSATSRDRGRPSPPAGKGDMISYIDLSAGVAAEDHEPHS